MQATKLWAGAMASAFCLTSSANAQYYAPAAPTYYAPVLRTPVGVAPDACGPGFYLPYGYHGQVIGPNYNLRPCFEPFQGVLPSVHQLQQSQQQSGQSQFPYHPYARSPRDFFMFRDVMEEQAGRQARPNLLP